MRAKIAANSARGRNSAGAGNFRFERISCTPQRHLDLGLFCCCVHASPPRYQDTAAVPFLSRNVGTSNKEDSISRSPHGGSSRRTLPPFSIFTADIAAQQAGSSSSSSDAVVEIRRKTDWYASILSSLGFTRICSSMSFLWDMALSLKLMKMIWSLLRANLLGDCENMIGEVQKGPGPGTELITEWNYRLRNFRAG